MLEYREVLARLVAARRFGVKLGLERMQELLARLGGPERHMGLVIHVGGTNGKGSVVAMIAAMVRAAGKRVATYTSPHLSTLRERVQIDGAMVSERQIVDAYATIVDAGGDELTFFEQITAMAFVIIGGQHVDVTVLEVGLGGRLDATNVVHAPIAIVTGVALDHEAILGDTIEKIAVEKAGIFKPGQTAIVGDSGEPEGKPMLIRLAREAGAHTIPVKASAGGTPADWISLAGDHQLANLAGAVLAVSAAGLPVVEGALERVVHPGRFERFEDLILDGAHNPHGARALAATLAKLNLVPVLVTAISADKNVNAIINELAGQVSAIVATRYQQDRSLEPEALAAICKTPHHAPDLRAAVALARSLGSPILIAGSLFLVGEARVAYLGAPKDPIATSDPPAKSS
ncbi:folylpolyglutamate synthase/dihydrofolate synthase family protein [soil metagenome]